MNETTTQRHTDTVFRRYTTLPHRRVWSQVDAEPYVDHLPDALAGVLRQFSVRMLDLGRLGIDDPERYQVYRSHVFDVRDMLLAQLADWLEFTGVTAPGTTTLRSAVKEALH